MQTRSPRAGGFLFVLALLAGLLIGIRAQALVTGMFAGAAVGLLLIVVVWLVDRRRR